MARYHLHLSECGTITPDDVGSVFASLEEARAAATRAARDVMCAEVQEGRLCLGCCVIITDEAGEELARVTFREALEITGLDS